MTPREIHRRCSPRRKRWFVADNRMELITANVLKSMLERWGESSEGASLLSCDSEAAVGNGENYCSNIYRIRLDVKLSSGKLLSRTLVVKAFLSNLGQDAKHEMTKFFVNETKIYEEILVNLGELAENCKLKDPRIWPKCYFASTDAIVFEDLNEAGFTTLPRQNGLKLEDGLQVIKFIGRFHALSVAADRRKLINPQVIRRTYAWVEPNGWITNVIKKSMAVAGDVVMQWGDSWVEPGQKLKNWSDRIATVLNRLYMEDVKLKVVNHGDAWTNNLMVKLGNDSRIQSVRFVDFQNTAYNSCGWDLVYFLYSSLRGDVMRPNYDKFLTAYRDEFVDTLQRLGEDPGLAPSSEDIKADVLRLLPFCLPVTCVVMAAAFNVSKHSIQVDELGSDDFKLKSLFTSDNWKSSMQVHIKYFQQRNLL